MEPQPRATCAAAGVLGEIEQLIVDQTVLRPESGHFPLFPLRPVQSWTSQSWKKSVPGKKDESPPGDYTGDSFDLLKCQT